MLTHRGIEANPDKCKAITEIRSPKNLKEIQLLLDRLMALSRFIPRLAERMRPIAQMLRKTAKFSCNEECETIFTQLKEFLSPPAAIQKPRTDLPIVVYLAVLEEAANAALVQDINNEEHPVYFVSRTFQVAETRYQMIEKVTLTLVLTAKRMLLEWMALN